ncbi:MAG TPA: hypothetical protein VMJ75_12555 [Candidatus Acidoferrales bacterium]|nr:hypothetical protein [Candidatus Acidoferrales bacterium]
MASEQQIRANRANGARSRGPKTLEGKARSSQNATRHGLRSKTVLMRNEDPEAFHRLLNMYVARLGPRDQAEMSLVSELAAALWRQRRAMTMERDTLELEMRNHSGDAIDRLVESFAAQLPRLQLLHRYQAHFNIALTRALRAIVEKQRGCRTNPITPLFSIKLPKANPPQTTETPPRPLNFP